MGLFRRRSSTKKDSSEGKQEEIAFKDALMQTSYPPLRNEDEAWDWACGQIARFKEEGLDGDLMLLLERNVLINLTGAYERNCDAFLGLAESAAPIVLTCEMLLNSGNASKAEEIADPYYSWLMQYEDRWGKGQLCFQGMVEASLYHIEHPEEMRLETADDSYTHFLVVYCRILGSILSETAQDAELRLEKQREALDIALRMSPCNFTVWNALANAYTGDEERFGEYAEKALRYCYQPGQPYGFGQVYADMAMHYALSNQQLGWALSKASEEYEGDPMGAMFLLAKLGYDASPDDDWESVLEVHGIQVGIGDICQRAIQAWEDYQRTQGGEVVD